jgi:UDP-N-acetylglucosamine 2-epimerase (non-hydrolysing)
MRAGPNRKSQFDREQHHRTRRTPDVRILHVVGARPNFMKVAPVMTALDGDFDQTLVHTGQHYDQRMSEIFFSELGLPEPDVNLGVGSGTHAVQTARIMIELERLLLEDRPDLVMVYGDVNSTAAAALVCSKLSIPLAHVEAGLRSRDRAMPEEINRLVTDQLSDLLFTPSTDGDDNLRSEGIAREKIHFVGNVMIDTLVRLLPKAEQRATSNGLRPSGAQYGLVTLHRPSNVDLTDRLQAILETLSDISRDIPLIFPVHPRTRERIDGSGMSRRAPRMDLIDPIGYLDFIGLQKGARLVITDSGGIQEETSYLGVPCLTMRPSTERPVTIELGTNILVGEDLGTLRSEVDRILSGSVKRGRRPPLWDGHAADRIADVLCNVGPAAAQWA